MASLAKTNALVAGRIDDPAVIVRLWFRYVELGDRRLGEQQKGKHRVHGGE
jgi:hypothetical protein